MVYSVAEGHKAVAEMNVFHDKGFVIDAEIIMCKVPDAFYACCRNHRCKFFGSGFWNTCNDKIRLVFLTVIHNIIGIKNFYVMERFAHKIDIIVKDSSQVYAVSFVEYKVCNCGTKAACANKHSIDVIVREKKVLDFIVEEIYAVAYTLLTETAEAVEVLTNLTWCGAHNFSKLAGGYSGFTHGFKFCDISEISWQTSDNR